MSKYDETKAKHAACKEKMSSAAWKKFAVAATTAKCPVCGGSR